eukprot:1539834-Rhodomonas_salina.1
MFFCSIGAVLQLPVHSLHHRLGEGRQAPAIPPAWYFPCPPHDTIFHRDSNASVRSKLGAENTACASHAVKLVLGWKLCTRWGMDADCSG